MKKIMIYLSAMSCAVTCMAVQDVIVLAVDNVATSTTADVSSSAALYGCIDRVYIDVGDGTNALTLVASLTVTDQFTSETRTLLASDTYNVTNNISVSPRFATVTSANVGTTNDYVPLRLHNDKVNFNVHTATATNRMTKAYIYYYTD